MEMSLDAHQNSTHTDLAVFEGLLPGSTALLKGATGRYERKFVVSSHEKLSLYWLLRINPALFKPIYVPRDVYNIYFDTPGRDFFAHNIEGVATRLKVRIRWYGSSTDFLENPQLECKLKSGLAGWKLTYPLPSLLLEEALEKTSLMSYLKAASIPDTVRQLVHHLEPTLLNRYRRSYFLSGCRRFRATVDTNLSYARPPRIGRSRMRFFQERDVQVLELKYLIDHDNDADSITTSFPFRVHKNSKYVRGLSMVESPEGVLYAEKLRTPLPKQTLETLLSERVPIAR